jgi:hypothetical protein
MTGMWVGLLLFTTTLTVQIDKEFANEKECWDWYNISSNYSHIETPVWLTCESSESFKGNDITGMIAPLTIILPTPSAT